MTAIIDANGAVLGRLGTYTAKRLINRRGNSNSQFGKGHNIWEKNNYKKEIQMEERRGYLS